MPPVTRADPSPSFRFHVKVGGLDIARFSECGGLDLESEPFDYQEGGLNSHVHRFPTRFKFANLTLKKGVATDGRTLWEWVKQAVKGANNGLMPIKPVTVILFDLTGTVALRDWNFNGAYPIKWSLVALSAEQNAIAIETLTLAHQGMDFSE